MNKGDYLYLSKIANFSQPTPIKRWQKPHQN